MGCGVHSVLQEKRYFTDVDFNETGIHTEWVTVLDDCMQMLSSECRTFISDHLHEYFHTGYPEGYGPMSEYSEDHHNKCWINLEDLHRYEVPNLGATERFTVEKNPDSILIRFNEDDEYEFDPTCRVSEMLSNIYTGFLVMFGHPGTYTFGSSADEDFGVRKYRIILEFDS